MAIDLKGNDPARTSGKVECYLVEYGDSDAFYDSARYPRKADAIAFYNRLGAFPYKRFYELVRVKRPGSRG